MYGAEVLAHEIKNENNSLEQVCSQFYRFILGVSKVTPKVGIKGEIGRPPIRIKAERAQIKYWYRLNTLPENHVLHSALKENIKNDTNWHKNIEKIVGKNDFNEVKEEHNINNINQLSKIMDIKLINEYKQSWKKQINIDKNNQNEGNKLRTYKLFKSDFRMEK